MLFAEILSLFQKGVEPDADYAQLSPPQVAEEYQPFVEEIQSLSEKYRPVYLMNVYGGLSSERMAEIMEISPEQTAEWLQAAQNEISEKTVPSENKKQRARSVQLFTAFRNPSGIGFSGRSARLFLRVSLVHQLEAEIFENDRQERKETDAMTEKTVSSD